VPKFSSRRLSQGQERLAGRSWEDVAPRMEELVSRINEQVSGGIPPGFNNSSPVQVQAGVEASPGTENAGWMAADAVISVETAAPSSILLGTTADEGTGTALARADGRNETIQLLAQVRNLVSLRI
jgi:hypothetical protein